MAPPPLTVFQCAFICLHVKRFHQMLLSGVLRALSITKFPRRLLTKYELICLHLSDIMLAAMGVERPVWRGGSVSEWSDLPGQNALVTIIHTWAVPAPRDKKAENNNKFHELRNGCSEAAQVAAVAVHEAPQTFSNVDIAWLDRFGSVIPFASGCSGSH